MTERSRRQQSTGTRTRRTSITAYSTSRFRIPAHQKLNEKVRQRRKLQQREQSGNTTNRRESVPEAPAATQRFQQCQRDEEVRDLQGRKQEIRGYGKARNRRVEHSTERSRLRGPRRLQVHVHDGRGVDGEDCDECENHVRAETESSESNRCDATPRPNMTRKATEEQKSAELNHRLSIVKRSLEEQHRNTRRSTLGIF